MKTCAAAAHDATRIVRPAWISGVAARFMARPRQLILGALAAIAAMVFSSLSIHTVYAQQAVAPTCPAGYVLSGGRCLAAAPAPTCPQGYVFSGGKCTQAIAGWYFITTKALGVKSARDLDGAAICLVTGSTAEAAVNTFFRNEGMKYEPVPVAAGGEAVKTYQSGACDVLAVQSHLAATTFSSLAAPALHTLLPEQIGGSTAAAPAPMQPCPYGTVRAGANCVPNAPRASPTPVYPAAALYPREVQANLLKLGCLNGRVDGVWGAGSRAALRKFSNLGNSGLPRNFSEPTQTAFDATISPSAPSCRRYTAPQRPNTVTKQVRCSKVKFAFTRGNTCACSGGRIFTGSACVIPQQTAPAEPLPFCANALNAICERQAGDACKNIKSDAKFDACFDRATAVCEAQNGCRN